MGFVNIKIFHYKVLSQLQGDERDTKLPIPTFKDNIRVGNKAGEDIIEGDDDDERTGHTDKIFTLTI